MYIKLRLKGDPDTWYLWSLSATELNRPPKACFEQRISGALRATDKLMVSIFNEIVSGQAITYFPRCSGRITLVGEKDELEASGVFYSDGKFRADAPSQTDGSAAGRG